MRTTIDLPEDLHRIATSIARDSKATLSETVATLMRRGLAGGNGTSRITFDDTTGLAVFNSGRPITSEDVRALDDEA